MNIPNGSNFAEFMIGKPYGYYYVFGEDLVEGMPTTGYQWWFIWHVPSGVWAVSANTNVVWRAELTNNLLYQWRKVAFGDSPQQYVLPLASQLPSIQSYTNCYCKTQENIVRVSFCIDHSDKFKKNEVFATLPVGYRPGHTIARCVAADGIEYGNGIVVAEIQVFSNGNIMLYHCNSDVRWLLGEISFIAEN